MKASLARVLTVNGGSSSIKFGLFEVDGEIQRVLHGEIEGIGRDSARMSAKGREQIDGFSRPITAPDHQAAVRILMDWLEERLGRSELAAVGHRVVHGGPRYTEHQRITPEMV